jgi:hypothetical protein
MLITAAAAGKLVDEPQAQDTGSSEARIYSGIYVPYK